MGPVGLQVWQGRYHDPSIGLGVFTDCSGLKSGNIWEQETSE